MFNLPLSFFFFFNDTATTEIYTLSLHDALPISTSELYKAPAIRPRYSVLENARLKELGLQDRKSTRLNSSHVRISYAVFCLKKKKKKYAQYSHVESAAPVTRTTHAMKHDELDDS